MEQVPRRAARSVCTAVQSAPAAAKESCAPAEKSAIGDTTRTIKAHNASAPAVDGIRPDAKPKAPSARAIRAR